MQAQDYEVYLRITISWTYNAKMYFFFNENDNTHLKGCRTYCKMHGILLLSWVKTSTLNPTLKYVAIAQLGNIYLSLKKKLKINTKSIPRDNPEAEELSVLPWELLWLPNLFLFEAPLDCVCKFKIHFQLMVFHKYNLLPQWGLERVFQLPCKHLLRKCYLIPRVILLLSVVYMLYRIYCMALFLRKQNTQFNWSNTG